MCRNPPGPFISVFHTVSSFHPFASTHTTFSSFSCTKWHMLIVYFSLSLVCLPCGQDNRLPSRPLLLDYTMTHDWFGHSNLHTNGKLTHCLRSTGTPQSDDDLNNDVRIKNNHYRQKYPELPEPVVFDICIYVCRICLSRGEMSYYLSFYLSWWCQCESKFDIDPDLLVSSSRPTFLPHVQA